MGSSSHRSPGATSIALLVLSLVLQVASLAEAAAPKVAVPLRVVVVGPIKALPIAKRTKAMAKQPAGTNNDSSGNDSDTDTDTGVPLVSARSFVLGNNITISQSRLVLSRLEQLFLLRQLLDTIDFAPKLSSSTGTLSTMGEAGGGATGNSERLEAGAGSFAEGFLFELEERAKLKTGGDAVDDLVDVAGSELGFGWRYPLSYWNQLGVDDKPKCAFGKSFGRFYYC